jgi:hypothetical protein
MWKVVDDKNVNIAHRFESNAKAQEFILYYKWEQSQTHTCPPGQHWDSTLGKCVADTPTCPPGQHWDAAQNKCVPDSPDGGLIEDGVKMFYPKVGDTKKFTYGSSNEGRAQWRCEIGKCMVNQEVTAVFDLHKGAVTNTGEEISIKLRGGRHTDSNKQEGSCYIIGVTYDGNANKQWEEPHPSNHAFPGHDKAGNFSVGNLDGKKIAVKAIVFLQGDHDHIECWLDTDPVKADGTFNNNYRKFWEHDSQEFTGKCNGNWALLRLDDIKGAPDNPEVDLLYGSVREINVGSAATKNAKIGRTLKQEREMSFGVKPTHAIDDTEDR